MAEFPRRACQSSLDGTYLPPSSTAPICDSLLCCRIPMPQPPNQSVTFLGSSSSSINSQSCKWHICVAARPDTSLSPGAGMTGGGRSLLGRAVANIQVAPSSESSDPLRLHKSQTSAHSRPTYFQHSISSQAHFYEPRANHKWNASCQPHH